MYNSQKKLDKQQRRQVSRAAPALPSAPPPVVPSRPVNLRDWRVRMDLLDRGVLRNGPLWCVEQRRDAYESDIAFLRASGQETALERCRRVDAEETERLALTPLEQRLSQLWAVRAASRVSHRRTDRAAARDAEITTHMHALEDAQLARALTALVRHVRKAA